MIALITSTIIPEAYSFFGIDDRYQQTIATINNLKNVGFIEIYLVDNSTSTIDMDRIKSNSYNGVKIIQSPQYTFENKGINEALLILNNLHHLPNNQPIFKISGRYSPTAQFSISKLLEELGSNEILGLGYIGTGKKVHFNTRAYLIENKKSLAQILVLAIEEMIGFSRGISGLNGLLGLLKTVFKPQIGSPFQISIENSFARILKARKKYKLVSKINIEGHIAGSKTLLHISE